jgi:hypothetical protein
VHSLVTQACTQDLVNDYVIAACAKKATAHVRSLSGAVVQVIITRDTTLVLNAERANEPLVKSFVEELQRRLSLYAAARYGAAAAAHDNGSGRGDGANGMRSSMLDGIAEMTLAERTAVAASLSGAAIVDAASGVPTNGSVGGLGGAVDVSAGADGGAAEGGEFAEADRERERLQAEQQVEEAAMMASSAREAQEKQIPYELQARRCCRC